MPGDMSLGGFEFPLTVVVAVLSSWFAFKAKVNGLENSMRGAFKEIRGIKDDLRDVEKALGRTRERLVRLESALFTPPPGYRGGGRDDNGSGD